ncbi:NUDIX domain-containing protein [Epidermidibacterium keratini]|uniref:8-oxo-dGTP diphosphatase n=1 Tax=Epidermidibacterium keratini TaxID=1891644 RepID=A0A7L4YNQ3_9ACTN|nr:NUDIX domain-containing protein [Epidermidibacterium keratini]QHC00895.1 NUDIX domain-containing protein [Epidermidibacterium keratini]
MPSPDSSAHVVAVALIRHGTVLAAQRSYPDEYAGRWELPGGKLSPGESPEQGAVREIAEELGVSIEVTGNLSGAVAIREGLDLIAVTARILEDGVPEAREHLALAWVAPEELDDLDWLEQDRAFLPELRELLLDGEAMPGGATGGATRIGETVRRPTGPWSPAVHGLLRHLDDTAGVPRLLGVDARGREVLSYIEGTTVRPDDQTLTDAEVESCGAMLRTIHDAMATYRPQGELQWRYGVRALGPGEVICHNDPGVYNWAFNDDRAAGLFDWDMAGPGDPMDDLAFLAWTAVPLYRDIDPPRAAERLRLLASAYGDVDAVDLLEAARRRMTTATERIAAGIARGDVGMQNLAAVGEPERTRGRLGVLAEHAPAIASHLDATTS